MADRGLFLRSYHVIHADTDEDEGENLRQRGERDAWNSSTRREHISKKIGAVTESWVIDTPYESLNSEHSSSKRL